MAQVVNVPGVGQLSFPDGMSQDDMASAIQKNFPQIHSQQPAQEERSFIGKLGHQLGNFGRDVVNAAAAPFVIASDAATGVLNSGLDAIEGKGNGFRFQSAGKSLNNLMDAAGVAKPETPLERVVNDMATGVGSVLTLGGIGNALTKTGGPVAKGIGEMLQQGPALQATSAATGEGASGIVREKGGSPGAQAVAGLVGAMAPLGAAALQSSTGGTKQLAEIAKTANKAGYVIPPKDLNPTAIDEVLSGVGGKIKTAQVASERNQQVTNQLVKNALGISDDVPLTKDALATIRNDAAKAYEAVSSAGTITPTANYENAIDAAVSPYVSQSRSFPNRKLPALVDDILSLKSPQFDTKDAIDTIRVLRNDADAAYRAGDAMAGRAYRSAANALESAIDEHLVSIGAPADLLQGYRDARQTIAKTWTVENALNPVTGNVDASKLAAALKKGAPLTDELRTVAEVAQAFPKATQMLKEAPGNISALDVAGAGLKAAVGNKVVEPVLTLGARPAARSLMLSDWYQNKSIADAGPRLVTSTAGSPVAAAIALARATGDWTNVPTPFVPVSKRIPSQPVAVGSATSDITSASSVDDAISAAQNNLGNVTGNGIDGNIDKSELPTRK